MIEKYPQMSIYKMGKSFQDEYKQKKHGSDHGTLTPKCAWLKVVVYIILKYLLLRL